ncbi:MAG: YesL family protein [Lachnospiraceae bacterium]|nr:YesL family protein [Lachnospiraceae bacterium]
MSGIFNMDSPLMRGLSRLADLMILNLLFLLCCIPIFTIGAALTGLNYVTLKIHDGEEGYIARSFFKSFKLNFKQATGMWLITLFVVAILAGDLFILHNMEGTFATVMTVIIIIICIACLMIFLYQFAILSRFENTVKNTFKNSFIMAIADFPRTVLMILIVAAAIIVTFFNGTTLNWAILFWFLVGFATISYCNTYFLSKIFNKYIPKEDKEKDPDAWDVDETMGPKEPADADSVLETENALDGNDPIEAGRALSDDTAGNVSDQSE